MELAASGYADHLTETDLRLLCTAAGLPASTDRTAFTDPALLEGLLADPRVFDAVFGDHDEVVLVSPFLAFVVAVHRAALDLAGLDYLPERSGLRQRIPVFDTPELRDFLGSAERRLFLAELLASFTRVASGRYRVPSGWGGTSRTRTRRFSELDPVRLAGMLDDAPEESRPGIYRRLGDVSLFLAGVFPDYSTMHALGPVDVSRLLRSARVPYDDRDHLATAPALDLLEYLGARWYRAALSAAPVRTARLDVVGDVAGRFRQARRVLNHLADRYLISPSAPWFPQPGTS
jgi:hypothetical protein